LKKKTKKMPPKNPKMTDVTSPGKTAPSASSRPIVVTNRSVLASDPMIVEAKPTPGSDASSDVMMHRTAKTIEPMAADAQVAVVGNAPLAETALVQMTAPETITPPEPVQEEPKTLTPPAAAPAPEEPLRDAEAAASAAESEAVAAEEARQQKLEELVETRAYAVPINAVQRKRSRMFIAAMCILAVVLALVLVDAVLDANIIKLPNGIPHTHFFSGTNS
jgi:hypothetical protein